MQDYNLKDSSIYNDVFLRVKSTFIQYFENTWLRGKFPLMWNMFKKVKKKQSSDCHLLFIICINILLIVLILGYNSKINKLIMTHCPNPNVLVLTSLSC